MQRGRVEPFFIISTTKTQLKRKSFSDKSKELPGICLNVRPLNTFLPQRTAVISTSLRLSLVLWTLRGKKGRRAKTSKEKFFFFFFNQQRNLKSVGLSGFKAHEALKLSVQMIWDSAEKLRIEHFHPDRKRVWTVRCKWILSLITSGLGNHKTIHSVEDLIELPSGGVLGSWDSAEAAAAFKTASKQTWKTLLLNLVSKPPTTGASQTFSFIRGCLDACRDERRLFNACS